MQLQHSFPVQLLCINKITLFNKTLGYEKGNGIVEIWVLF